MSATRTLNLDEYPLCMSSTDRLERLSRAIRALPEDARAGIVRAIDAITTTSEQQAIAWSLRFIQERFEEHDQPFPLSAFDCGALWLSDDKGILAMLLLLIDLPEESGGDLGE